MPEIGVSGFIPPLLNQWGENDVAKLDGSVVALQDDGARLAFVGIARNGGETFDYSLVDHFPVIQDDGDLASHKPDVVGLPLARRLAGIFRRCDTAIERAITVQVRRLAVVF